MLSFENCFNTLCLRSQIFIEDLNVPGSVIVLEDMILNIENSVLSTNRYNLFSLEAKF